MWILNPRLVLETGSLIGEVRSEPVIGDIVNNITSFDHSLS